MRDGERGRLLGTDKGGEVVEAVALVASNRVAVAVVGPGSDEEHLPAGAGIEHISAGFPHGRETVFKQLDEGEACGLDHVHDGSLTGTDAGRNKHGTALCHHQETGGCCFDVGVGHFAGTFHNDLIGAVEQESVTHDSHVVVANQDVLLRLEEFGIIALGP